MFLAVALSLGVVPIAAAQNPRNVSSEASSASGRVYAANCGTVGYLAYKPRTFSVGCTAGSPQVRHARWVHWSLRSARATGTSYVENCSPACSNPSHHAVYPSAVVLSHPVWCTQGARLRYFSRAVWTITYPAGNPFHQHAGRHTFVARKPASGPCQRANNPVRCEPEGRRLPAARLDRSFLFRAAAGRLGGDFRHVLR